VVLIGLTIWFSESHSLKNNGQHNATIQNVFTYGVALIFVLVVLGISRKLRQMKPVADAIQAEPVIFKTHVDVSFAGGGMTFRDLIVREHSF
jgi:hypothetical protein